MDAGSAQSDETAGIDPLLPPQIAAKTEALGVAKARMPFLSTFVLAVLAGAFIALGADFFTVVTTDSGLGYGTTRLLGGVAFSLGLVLVVIGGAELFTGNNLIVMAWASRRISALEMGRNWVIVYTGKLRRRAGDGDHRVRERPVEVRQLRGWRQCRPHRRAQSGFGIWEAIALGALCNALCLPRCMVDLQCA